MGSTLALNWAAPRLVAGCLGCGLLLGAAAGPAAGSAMGAGSGPPPRQPAPPPAVWPLDQLTPSTPGGAPPDGLVTLRWPGLSATLPGVGGLPTPATITPTGPPLGRLVGQLVIGSYRGRKPPQALLRAVRRGQLGAVILMGSNTAAGVGSVRAATAKLQAAARSGGNPGLLVMTDQEGGEVKRLAGPPWYAAADMSSPALARRQGTATGRLLRRAGVNMDLAPVADVVRRYGFIAQERRSFGARPGVVAAAACAFAAGLASQRVAYTLKHFPGLGSAIASTDAEPVNVTESRAALRADAAPYRRCAHGSLAAVMISSASYRQLTGRTPAVLSAAVYGRLLPADGVSALTISDSFEAGAIEHLRSPARRAIGAGLDMVMYPAHRARALAAYRGLLTAARSGLLRLPRLRAAYARVLALKLALGLSPG